MENCGIDLWSPHMHIHVNTCIHTPMCIHPYIYPHTQGRETFCYDVLSVSMIIT